MSTWISKLRWPYREDTVFSILSFIVFVVPLAFSVLTNENFETVKLVLWLVFAGFALGLWLRRKLRHPSSNLNPRFALLVLGMTGWALVSALLAPDKLYSFFGFYYRFTNSFGFLLLWSLTLLLLIDTLDKERYKFLLKILFIDALLIAVKSLLEASGWTLYLGSRTDPFYRSAPSFLGNPNYSCMFVACMLPLAGFYIWQDKRFWARIFYALSMFSMLGCLFVLASRGALVGLVGGLGALLFLLLWIKADRRTLVKAAAALVVLVVAIVGVVHITRPATLNLHQQDTNISLRLAIWRKSLFGAFEHPLTGVGVGNFALYDERGSRPASMGIFDDPHNLWLFLAVSGGWPLLILFVSIIGMVSWSTLARLRKTFDPLLLASLVAVVIFIIAASFTPVPIPAFLILAVALAGMWVESSRLANGIRFSWPVVVPLGLVASVFILWGVALAAGEAALHIGYQAFTVGDMQRAAALFKFSQTVNPTNQLAGAYRIQADVRLGVDARQITAELATLRRLHPTQAATRVLASDAEFDWFTITKDEQHLDQSIGDLKAALAIDPYYPERYGQLGFYYYLKEDYDQALRNLEYSLQLKPDLLSSLLVEARIYQLQGDRPRLLAALQQARTTHLDDLKLRYVWFVAKHETDVKKIPLNFSY